MSRTRLRQDTQLGPSVQVTDQLAVTGASQPAATSLQDEMNILRSVINRALNTTLTGNFTDPPLVVNGKSRGLNQLNTATDALETKPLMFPVQSGAVVAVPSGQNFVLLSVAGNQAPTQNAAIGPTSAGAVVAKSTSSGSAFLANETTLLAGTNPLSPRNLVRLRNSANGQVIQSNDNDVYGLLQVESTAIDGAAFSDTASSSRVKISFVVVNYQTMAFVPAPSNDIGGQSINFMYRTRQQWANLPDDFDFTNSTFSELMAETDVTLSRGAANQMGPINVPNSLQWQVATGKTFKVQDASGAHDIISVVPASGNNALTLSPDNLVLNTTNTTTANKGVTLATGSQAVNLGVGAGQVDSAGLTLASTGSNTLKVVSGQAINLRDVYQTGSTWAGSGIALAASTSEWNTYRSTFGEVSILAGIALAAKNANHGKRYAAVVPATISPGTVVTGAGASPNIDQQLFNFTEVDPLTDMDVFVNGAMLRPGTGASSNFDYYIGGNPANGELVFNFTLYGGTNPDVVTVCIYGAQSAA